MSLRPALTSLALACTLVAGCSDPSTLAVGYSSASCAWKFEDGKDPALQPLVVGSKLTLPIFGLGGGVQCKLTGKIPTPTCDQSFDPTGLTATSSAPEIVAVEVVDGLVVATALKAGSATVRVTSAEVTTPAEATLVVVEPKLIWMLEGEAVTSVSLVAGSSDLALEVRLATAESADACPAGLKWSVAGTSVDAGLDALLPTDEHTSVTLRVGAMSAAQGAVNVTVGPNTLTLPLTRVELGSVNRLEAALAGRTLAAHAFVGETRAFGATFHGQSLDPDVVRFSGGAAETDFEGAGVDLEPATKGDGSSATGSGRVRVSLPGSPAPAVEVLGSF